MSADRRVVLDASAVLAWLLDENGATVIDKSLPFAVIPAPNLAEALYRGVERGHRMPMSEMHAALTGSGAKIEPMTEHDAVRAAELITESRTEQKKTGGSCLSLGDGLCLAVAERLDLPVTGGDLHWETCDLRIEFFPFR